MHIHLHICISEDFPRKDFEIWTVVSVCLVCVCVCVCVFESEKIAEGSSLVL